MFESKSVLAHFTLVYIEHVKHESNYEEYFTADVKNYTWIVLISESLPFFLGV